MTSHRSMRTRPAELIEAAGQAVAAGRARPISAYITGAAQTGRTRLALAAALPQWGTGAGRSTDPQHQRVHAWLEGIMRPGH